MNVDYLLYALIAVGVFTGYMALVHMFRRDRQRQRVLDAASPFNMDSEEAAASPVAALSRGLLAMVGVDVKNQKELSMLLLQAGIRSPNAVTYFLVVKRLVQPLMLVAGALLLLMLITSGGSAMSKILSLALAVFLIGFGLFGADLYITNQKQRRQKILLLSFPEALDLLLVCIESGLGLDAAIGRVCAELRESHPEVAAELERTRVELTVLPDRTVALQNLAARTEIVPFKSLVAALIQTEKFGTSLLDTLRVLSEDQRSTRLLNAETRAARLPVLITIPLILCILPSFILIILGPPIVKVIEQGGLFGNASSQ